MDEFRTMVPGSAAPMSRSRPSRSGMTRSCGRSMGPGAPHMSINMGGGMPMPMVMPMQPQKKGCCTCCCVSIILTILLVAAAVVAVFFFPPLHDAIFGSEETGDVDDFVVTTNHNGTTVRKPTKKPYRQGGKRVNGGKPIKKVVRWEKFHSTDRSKYLKFSNGDKTVTLKGPCSGGTVRVKAYGQGSVTFKVDKLGSGVWLGMVAEDYGRLSGEGYDHGMYTSTYAWCYDGRGFIRNGPENIPKLKTGLPKLRDGSSLIITRKGGTVSFSIDGRKHDIQVPQSWNVSPAVSLYDNGRGALAKVTIC